MLRIWMILSIFCATMAQAGTEMGGGGTRARWQAIFDNPRLFVEAPTVTFDTGEVGTMFTSITQVCYTKKDGQEFLRNLTPYFPCERWGTSDNMGCAIYSKTPTYLERSRKQMESGCEAGQVRGRPCANGKTEKLIPLSFELKVYGVSYGEGLNANPLMTLPYDIPGCD